MSIYIVSRTRGFTREILSALLVDVESMEFQRVKEDLPVEHPKASTTDDVECFLTVLRDRVGRTSLLRRLAKVYLTSPT